MRSQTHPIARGPLLAALAASLLSAPALAVVPKGPAPPAVAPTVAAPAPAPTPADVPPAPPPAAAPPPAPPPAAAPPAAAPPPVAAPAPRPRLPPKPKGPPPEPLPEPELRARVIAPSAQGPWTLRLENEGSRWLRVPADIRLLHFTIESGDTVSRRVEKPIKCAVPAGLRPQGFPERNALLLGPGDAYVESFDPRLFCFGKETRALAGGALVRAHYGWEQPKGARKTDAPYAVEGTAFPATVQPKKMLVVPSMVLSWLPAEDDEAEGAVTPIAAAPPPAPVNLPPLRRGEHRTHPASPPVTSKKGPPRPAETAAPPDENSGPDGAPGEKRASDESKPVDENAPRLELKATPFVDAVNAHKVSLTLTLTNAGHRPALAVIRSRMAGFRIDGPDGPASCSAAAPTHAIARDGFSTLRPGASTALTILITEACRQDLFRRPGLYRITPFFHLGESGAELGLSALTGRVRAAEPTLVRVAEGPDPFYPRPPQAVRAPRGDHEGEPHPPASDDAPPP